MRSLFRREQRRKLSLCFRANNQISFGERELFFSPAFILCAFSFYDRMICAVLVCVCLCVCVCLLTELRVAQGAREAGEGGQDGRGRYAHG